MTSAYTSGRKALWQLPSCDQLDMEQEESTHESARNGCGGQCTMTETFLNPLFVVALGIGLLAIVSTGVIYWYFKRKFDQQARQMENWDS